MNLFCNACFTISIVYLFVNYNELNVVDVRSVKI